MKIYAIATALLLTLTGCAATTDTADTRLPSLNEASDGRAEVDLSAEFKPSQESLENLVTNLMASCDKGLEEGMVEVGNGVRIVVLPESASYESYSAFYELEDKSYAELVYSLDFSSACSLPFMASQYAESTMDEPSEADWNGFPVKVEQLDENRFRVLDESSSTDDMDLGFESIYLFENGLLVSQEIEDYFVELTYGNWTEEDTQTIKKLVDELFAEE